MPFDTITAADGTFRCTDPTCRGSHEPQRFSTPVVVRAWTRQTAGGPAAISRTEHLPLQMPENCAVCGGPVEITEPPMTSGSHGRDYILRWPVPRVSPGLGKADEIVAAPAPDLTLEQRVEQLERAMAS